MTEPECVQIQHISLLDNMNIANDNSAAELVAYCSPDHVPGFQSTDSSDHLPFSTPGPASLISASSSAVSAPNLVPQFLQTDMLDPALRQDSPGYAPFSKPGPLVIQNTGSFASTVSLDNSPEPDGGMLSSLVLNRTAAAAPFVSHPILMGNLIDSVSPSRLPENYVGFNHAYPPSPSTAWVQESHLSSPVVAPNSTHGIDASRLPNPYSTPGPAHNPILPVKPNLHGPHYAKNPITAKHVPSALPCASPFKVYFNSPAEDPCMSDPLDEADYELALDYDVEALGFKWEKFERGGEDSVREGAQDAAGAESADGSEEDARLPLLIGDNYQLHPPHTPLRVAPPAAACAPALSSSPPSLPVAGCDGERTEDTDIEDLYMDDQMWLLPARTHVSPPPSQSGVASTAEAGDAQASPTRGPSFAPTPGIFLSPLRGAKEVDEDEVAPAKEDDMNSLERMEDPNRPATSTAPQNEGGEAADQEGTCMGTRATPPHDRLSHPVESCSDVGAGDVQGQTQDETEVEDPNACSSQESHDTIESWTGVE
ncbi:hypothetical protein B0H21DRAFT_741275 [Amylocystis lapponica]|nr:hypothetical protein B0H21DRAFT_741275 [Amylocystis lapponica]